jgi:hypothetical protein
MLEIAAEGAAVEKPLRRTRYPNQVALCIPKYVASLLLL